MRAVIIMGLGDGLPMEPPMARIMGQINLPPRRLPRYIHDKNALSGFSYNPPGYIYKPYLLSRDIHDFDMTINRALSQYWGLLGLWSVDPNAREARIRSHSTTPVIKGDPCTLDIKYMVGK